MELAYPEAPSYIQQAVSKDGDYKMIVISSHCRNSVARVLLGNVAKTVVGRASVPVLVVR